MKKYNKDVLIRTVAAIIVSGAICLGVFYKISLKDVGQEKYEIKNVADKNYVVKIKDGYNEEVLNISLVDNFIKNVENKKSDEVFIIEYEKNKNKEIVTSLQEINYDEKKIEVTNYDVSNEKEFKEKEKKDYFRLWKVGDNFGAKIVATKSEVEPVINGDILFEYVESNTKEYK